MLIKSCDDGRWFHSAFWIAHITIGYASHFLHSLYFYNHFIHESLAESSRIIMWIFKTKTYNYKTKEKNYSEIGLCRDREQKIEMALTKKLLLLLFHYWKWKPDFCFSS